VHSAYCTCKRHILTCFSKGTISEIINAYFIIYHVALSESLNVVSFYMCNTQNACNPKPSYNERPNKQITLESNRTEFHGY
jgi:hypothetical protein